MTPHEFPGSIHNRVTSGHDRQSTEVASNVFRELLDRGISTYGLLAQRLEHDGVEISGEAFPKRVGAHRAGGARLLVANGPCEIVGPIRPGLVRRAAGENAVEQDAKRVHISGG